jgi:hypothetical protein
MLDTLSTYSHTCSSTDLVTGSVGQSSRVAVPGRFLHRCFRIVVELAVGELYLFESRIMIA